MPKGKSQVADNRLNKARLALVVLARQEDASVVFFREQDTKFAKWPEVPYRELTESHLSSTNIFVGSSVEIVSEFRLG